MTTRTPTGGLADDDLETLLRAELAAVADAFDTDGPVPTSALVARGRTVRRRRRVAITGAAALATAAALTVGFVVVNPMQRADSSPAVETPSPEDTNTGLEAWIKGLPVGEVPELPRNASQGTVVRDGTPTPLPTVKGLSRFAVPFGSADRGLLLGWVTDAPGDNPPSQLGWLGPDGRWTAVDTLHLTSAAVSPDGATYVYAGSPATGAAGSIPAGKAFVQERSATDDTSTTRSAVPDGSIVKGWFDGGWLLTRDDGTQPSVLEDEALVPRDLVPTAPSGEPPVAITSVHGDVVTYTLPSFQGCPAVRGASTVYLAATRFAAGAEAGQLTLGCFAPLSDPVSPDGTHAVRGGDEFTIRSVAGDGNPPVGPVGPETSPGTTVVTWEPDGAHVQIEYLTPDATARPATTEAGVRYVVRCATTDGSCVRKP